MKVNKKKLTNKDFENRDNILMIEIENLKHVIDSAIMTIFDYIEYNGDVDNLKKFMEDKYGGKEDVRSELQKSGS